MAKERFTLTSGKDLMWTVTDNENGIAIDFREGLFNKFHEVKLSADFLLADAPGVARILYDIGDWMAANHVEVALSDWEARRSAIWKLSNEKYWLAMAATTNSLLLSDIDAEHAACMLYAEVCDWLEIEKTVDLTKAEEENLKGVLSELTDAEAWEVFKMLHVFWNYKTDQGDMFQWAIDVTWWPAWLPTELKESEDDDIIDEK